MCFSQLTVMNCFENELNISILPSIFIYCNCSYGDMAERNDLGGCLNYE